MVAQVVSLFSRVRAAPDWSQQELAEFYRVESALVQAGLQIETDRGLSDEGDPWFVFCRAEDGEVVIHFARFDGHYVIAGPAYEGVARGHDFPALIRDLISRHPLVQPRGPSKKSNVVLHPAALLIAIVGTAFFKTGDVRAAERQDKPDAPDESARQKALPSLTGSGAAQMATINVDAHQTLTILAGAMIAASWRERDVTAHADRGLLSNSWQPNILDVAGKPAPISNGSGPTLTPDAAAFGSSQLTPEAVMEAKAMFAVVALLNDLVTPGLASSGDAPPAFPMVVEGDRAVESRGVFEILLVTGASNGTLAFQWIRDADVADELGAVDIAYLDALPRLLAELIAGGLTARVENDGTVDLDAPAVNAPPPIVMLDDGALVPSLPRPSPPLAPDHTETSLLGVFAPNAEIGEVIDYFVAHTHDVEVLVVDDQIVIYDVRLTTNSHAEISFQSITFDFDDGSSISLIGAISAISGYDLVT